MPNSKCSMYFMILKLVGVYLVICGILYFFYEVTVVEGMTTNIKNRCPDILIQHGTRFYLYNSKIENTPGINPITFANLEEYVTFLKWQRSQGIRCPVLYIQKTYNAQGMVSYKAKANVTEPQNEMSSTSHAIVNNVDYSYIVDNMNAKNHQTCDSQL